jgi:hypothetical protein
LTITLYASSPPFPLLLRHCRRLLHSPRSQFPFPRALFHFVCFVTRSLTRSQIHQSKHTSDNAPFMALDTCAVREQRYSPLTLVLSCSTRWQSGDVAVRDAARTVRTARRRRFPTRRYGLSGVRRGALHVAFRSVCSTRCVPSCVLLNQFVRVCARSAVVPLYGLWVTWRNRQSISSNVIGMFASFSLFGIAAGKRPNDARRRAELALR